MSTSIRPRVVVAMRSSASFVLAVLLAAFLAACGEPTAALPATQPVFTVRPSPTVATVELTASPSAGASPTAAVAPSPTAAPTPAHTATPAAAATPAPTAAPATTPLASPTQAPTALPKTPFALSGEAVQFAPPGFLLYEAAAYNTFENEISGTTVEVAVHRDMTGGRLISGFPAMEPAEFADFVFGLFEHHRRVFGDYPFDRYRVVVRGPNDDPLGHFVTHRLGLDVAFGGYTLDSAEEVEPPHGFTWPFAMDWMAHEMFHAWNGQLIQPQPDGTGRVYQAETWLSEGATVYFTARSHPDDPEFFHDMMEEQLEDYSEEPELAALSFADLAASTLPATADGMPPPWNEAVGMLYTKGALVSYMLDAELRRHGSSLDDLMARLYIEHGLTGIRYTNANVLVAANDVAGADLTAFFQNYVFSGEPLPLTGDFDLFEAR